MLATHPDAGSTLPLPFLRWFHLLALLTLLLVACRSVNAQDASQTAGGGATTQSNPQDGTRDIVGFLTSGHLAEGQAALERQLASSPKNDQLRVGLGLMQFFTAVEHLSQSMYRYGRNDRSALMQQIPLLRMTVANNERPETVRYADLRRVLQNFIDDATVAEKTLAAVEDQAIKLTIPLAKIKLDLNGNGMAEREETIWNVYTSIALRNNTNPAHGDNELIVSLDYADVLWLRGYCNLLSAVAHFILMYDEQTLFDTLAGQLFAKPDLPASKFKLRTDEPFFHYADIIAAVHLANFQVIEPERGVKVLNHLKQVVALSRKTWDAIQSESDNDHEWIPSPKQTGVFKDVVISEQMIKTWRSFLDEAEQLLDGKLLIPHWRLPVDTGMNLKRFLTEPRALDVVMLVHGNAALPYTEFGPCSRQETWRQFQAVFGGRFIGFAAWFN